MKKLIAISIFLSMFLILNYFVEEDSLEKLEDKEYDFFDNLEEENVSINKYIIYGTHLNISGTLNKSINSEEIKEISLVLKSLSDDKEIEYKIKSNINDSNVTFYTSDIINEGINLEDIEVSEYIMLLKISYNTNEYNYYSFKNNTEYGNLEYYTVTKNNSNKKINITFNKYTEGLNNIDYMEIDVNKCNLPDNVYDIVIDPGHGGNDSGATKDEYKESEITLDYCIDLKKNLENLGLKVKLTRQIDEYIDAYGDNGRAVIPNEVKAKYVFSIHLNSSEYTMQSGGVEVYAPNLSNLDFAKSLADNIVQIAQTTYSPKSLNQAKNGVYVRNYTEDEIKEAKYYAKELNYKEYNITTATPYIFMIRETGGIATNAYMDGRNINYGINKYYNSNIGVEGYLIEIGYMTCDKDLNNIIENKYLYVKAISQSIAYKIGI